MIGIWLKYLRRIWCKINTMRSCLHKKQLTKQTKACLDVPNSPPSATSYGGVTNTYPWNKSDPHSLKNVFYPWEVLAILSRCLRHTVDGQFWNLAPASGWLKPSGSWDISPINWCGIFAINNGMFIYASKKHTCLTFETKNKVNIIMS